MRPLVALLLLSSCTSYRIQAECERTDWYAYGHQAAMEGRRLSGDHKIDQCAQNNGRVDDVALDHGFKEGMASYCEPETVFVQGKKGEFFNEDMCETRVRLQREHQAGIRIYCQKENGFSAGATGRKYNGICPKDLEQNFVAEFNRGRKNFLNATIASNESALGDIEVKIGHLESQRFMYNSQLTALPAETSQVATAVVDPTTGIAYSQGPYVDSAIVARRNDLELQMQNIDASIAKERFEAEKLRTANRDLRVEMTLL